MTAKQIGQRIQTRRNAEGLTQQQLERKAKLAQGVVSQFENGHRGPSFQNLIKLCRALGTSADYLLGLA